MKQPTPELEDIAERSETVREEKKICPHQSEGALFPSRELVKYCHFDGTLECEHKGERKCFYGIDRCGKVDVAPLNLCDYNPKSETPKVAD